MVQRRLPCNSLGICVVCVPCWNASELPLVILRNSSSSSPKLQGMQAGKLHFWSSFIIRMPDNILSRESKINFSGVRRQMNVQNLSCFQEAVSYTMLFIHVKWNSIRIRIVSWVFKQNIFSHLSIWLLEGQKTKYHSACIRKDWTHFYHVLSSQ